MRVYVVLVLGIILVAAPASHVQAQALTGQYSLKVAAGPDLAGKFLVTVYVNGKLAATFSAKKPENDITAMLKKGTNTIRFVGEVMTSANITKHNLTKTVTVTLGVFRGGKWSTVLVYAMPMTTKGKLDKTLPFVAD